MDGNVINLPPLREELDLFPGPCAFDGSPTWTLYDPVNQHFYRIGRLENEILAHWELSSPEAISEQVSQYGLFTVSVDDILQLLQFLAGHNLLQVRGKEAVQRLVGQARAAHHHWFVWLIHHYLFFKIPLIRPDRLLALTYPALRWIYRPMVLYVLMALVLVNLYLLIDRWDMFSRTFLHFFSTEGFVYYAVALTLTKTLHELGHAYTAHRYGCRVSAMGVAFLVMMPVLYTDASEAWKLTSRRQRLAIGFGGIAAELGLAVLCTTLWHFLPDGPLRSSVFLMATTTWIMTLFINLNPLMRFDGYFLLSDYWGIENLQNRAFALGRWQLRRILFGFLDEAPERFPPHTQRLLLIYAWSIWIYRFFLFLGIALLVYHFFFKLLGLFLMMVEVGWFIMLPIVKEIKHWIEHRQHMEWNRNTLTTLSAVLIAIGILFIPWQNRIEAPGLLKIAAHTELFMPLPAKLDKILVAKGETVKSGQALVQFSSPDLESKLEQSKIKIDSLRWEQSFHGQEKSLSDRHLVVMSELESALSEYDSLMDERKRLTVVAPFDGEIIEINDQLNVGEWIAKDEPLLTVGQFDSYQIEAFLAEDHLGQIQPGAKADFYPEQLDWPGMPCRIIRIDNAAAMQLPPVFTSRYNGSIAIRGNNKEVLVPETSVYRVWLQPMETGEPIHRAIKGNVLIDGKPESVASFLWRQVAAVLIRESGF
ncbi:HlyD family efflux transporter periplasmic adaptor subunit [Methylobacter sp.]|uniref:HlyD family efflux transporter periplasmic adaptor subunit n=1 Tax=Methylobacter sp. TaxID=2051955 RepID=UPI00248943A2|nr:HlyD family efflux transporter periplasmic adaptor subunit [Methylobacter sp.]MDI1277185.1 HlyD family efflux transporter periplasmic adaptor subunit [Methylobacter sp.]MDI1358686.1 HlyD family efflux transporter periplasmic adaptor subunit [Methylobacter sp.]